jgi:hypothetical protein
MNHPEPVLGPGVKGLDTEVRGSVKPVSEGDVFEGRESRKSWICKHLSLMRESRNRFSGLDLWT